MLIHLVNTSNGLYPATDFDFDEKKKLKLGRVYSCEIKLVRNYEFHKKFFALINCSWEYLNEPVQAHFGTIDKFREAVQVTAGHSQTFYSIDLRQWVDVPKSISFKSMDNGEFQDLYNRVREVIFAVFLKHIDLNEFEKELINF